MLVETLSSSRLHLKRAPGIRSWSLLVGKGFHISPQIKNLTLKIGENETAVFLPCFTPDPQTQQLSCLFVFSGVYPLSVLLCVMCVCLALFTT